MSEYTERFVRLGEEDVAWGTYATVFQGVNWAKGFDATTIEERIEEDIIAASRQARSRVFVQKETAGSFEMDPISPKMFYYALGSITTDATSPYTLDIVGDLALPGFTIERGLRGTSTIYAGYYGCKVDRLELTIEQQADVVMNIDWAAKGNTFPTAYTWGTVAPSEFSKDPWSYHETCFKMNGTAYRFNRFRLEINNNLEARYAAECTAETNKLPFELREGLQAVSGEFVVDESVNTFYDIVDARSEGTINVIIGTSAAAGTKGSIDITMVGVALEQYEDSLRGREPYEVTFPFTARASAPNAYDAITVQHQNAYAGTVGDLYL